ncbi:MAG: hypothetical protein HEQ34_01590 [Sphingorhabdus sp.]|uniref:hypothetical protein n=1 Tax=Sphingorhabdus sp. TaxID=1902408 RepID=UPI0025E2EA90|nr:hypothetical protein [Sphingorhabdus sp.]MCO4090632.1 hypothetical protein [Sphingorhabdus sp.]
MTSKRIILRRLAFSGPTVPTAEIQLIDGPNVIFGASNTGKSFTIKALNYMFGGSSLLPEIEQREGYEGIWLGLTLPGGIDVTLYRSLAGGGFNVFEGLEAPAGERETVVELAPKYHAGHPENISTYLLHPIGLDGKILVRNENGEKATFTIRTLAPFLFVDEGNIISEGSPFLSGQRDSATLEKNALRLLLTGADDSSVVPVLPPKIRKAQQAGQLALVEEMIANIDKELGEGGPDRQQLHDQLSRIEMSLQSLQTDLIARQDRIDQLTVARRTGLDELNLAKSKRREGLVTIARFEELERVYGSDIERLQGLEEGGGLFAVRAGRACPLCGASAEAHTMTYDSSQIAEVRNATLREIAKIQSERDDLRYTLASVRAELDINEQEILRILAKIDEAENSLSQARPDEAASRKLYEERGDVRDSLRITLELFRQRDKLQVRFSQLSASIPRGRGDDKLSVGIDGPTGHALAAKVQEVLSAWQFPNSPTVSFNDETQDIRLNGKPRAANGKGVRAILHAASKVAALLLCQEKDLPHPGFVVLDTPLLTYREPLKNPKHGELADDEAALKATSLHEAFYQHLISLKDQAQIVVLENADPPLSLREEMNIITFTGGGENDRFGLFPAQIPS